MGETLVEDAGVGETGRRNSDKDNPVWVRLKRGQESGFSLCLCNAYLYFHTSSPAL